MILSPRVNDLHARFCGTLTHRYFIRVHMSVMLALVLLSGVVAGSVLRRAGLTHMGVRYPIAVLFSYAVFLGLVRIWVAYMCSVSGFAPRRGAQAGGSGSTGDGLLDGAFSSGGGGSSSGAAEGFAGGGGSFGGGGSSGSFGEVTGSSARASNPLSFFSGGKAGSSGGGGHSGSGGGGGGDGDGLLLLILFGVLVAAVFGAGAYLVYQAPVILSETAFHAVLAGGLVRTARGAHEPGWMGSALKATALPFALVLILAGVFGFQAHKLCPGAATVGEVFHSCIFK